MKFSVRSSISLRIALGALFGVICYAQPAATRWTAATARPDLFVRVGSSGNSAPQSILLVGENHASVKTQNQLADLLEALYKNRSVDAILIEGSNGEISPDRLRDRVAANNAKSAQEFWKGQLNQGQIAGYEYVALTQPGVRIRGVEDMDEKRRYTAGEASRSVVTNLQEQADLHTRALALARSSLANAGRSGSGADAVLDAYAAKIAELQALTKKNGADYAAAEGAYTDGVERITALYSKLQTVLPAYEQLAKQATAYDQLVARARKLSAGGSLPEGTDAAKLLADLEAAKGRVDQVSADFETAFKKAGYPDIKAVNADLTGIEETEKSIKTTEANLTTLGAPFGKLVTDLNNRFFQVANAVRTELGKPVPALQTFLRDELEKARAKARADDSEKPYLADRDKFMVANTMEYLRANPAARNVVLIIGYAHLEGISGRLAKENVSVIAGKLASSEEEIDQWENRAWERRSRPSVSIFSRASRKELSRFLDRTYENEIPALLAKLETVTTNPSTGVALGKTRIFEATTGRTGRKAIVATTADNLKSDWGSHVVHMGTLPDGKGTPYLIVDRDKAHADVKVLSSKDIAFTTLYRTKNQQGWATKLDTAEGTETLADFKNRAPRSKRVVIAAEGDELPLNNLLANGGGRGGEPPWTSRRAVFAEPPDENRASWFFTKNMRAANERLQKIEEQDPLTIGDIATIRLGFADSNEAVGLNHLWFTPETGEHARAYFIVGDNTPEFRRQLKEAGEAGLLRNKQIALGTCFDENESNALHDMLLEYGALMVWSPSKRISPEAATKLAGFMQQTDAGSVRVRGLDEYMDQTLRLWHKTDAKDPDLEQLLDSVNRARVDLIKDDSHAAD